MNYWCLFLAILITLSPILLIAGVHYLLKWLKASWDDVGMWAELVFAALVLMAGASAVGYMLWNYIVMGIYKALCN